ncbi:unnamed protein product, partial [Effrenium voratum]
LVASPDAPSTTQRLKTQSSRLSRRLKMEAQRVVPGCFFGSCAASSPSGNPNDVFAETGRFTVTPFVGLKRPLLAQPARSAAAGRAPERRPATWRRRWGSPRSWRTWGPCCA